MSSQADEYAMSGAAFLQLVRSRRLRPAIPAGAVDLVAAGKRLPPPYTDKPPHHPPAGAPYLALLVASVAQWKIPGSEPHAGETYRAVHVTGEQLGELLRVWPPRVLAWLKRHQLLAVAARKGPGGYGGYFIAPGPALRALMRAPRRPRGRS